MTTPAANGKVESKKYTLKVGISRWQGHGESGEAIHLEVPMEFWGKDQEYHCLKPSIRALINAGLTAVIEIPEGTFDEHEKKYRPTGI